MVKSWEFQIKILNEKQRYSFSFYYVKTYIKISLFYQQLFCNKHKNLMIIKKFFIQTSRGSTCVSEDSLSSLRNDIFFKFPMFMWCGLAFRQWFFLIGLIHWPTALLPYECEQTEMTSTRSPNIERVARSGWSFYDIKLSVRNKKNI